MKFPDPLLPPILVVDDSQDDAFDLRYRLRAGQISNPVRWFDSVAASGPYLRSAQLVQTPPELLFIDIRMPGAADFIATLRQQPEFDPMKIVILTYSNDPADLQHAFELRIDGYLLKFPPADDLADFVRHGPWFAVARRIETVPHALCA